MTNHRVTQKFVALPKDFRDHRNHESKIYFCYFCYFPKAIAERVTFRWKDYAHGGKQGQMTLTATEFLRRFFLHVLPKGFVRIRHFGFLANRFPASRLLLSRQLLASSSATEQRVGTHDLRSEDACLWHCPRCGPSMIVIQRFTAEELPACTYFDSS